MTQVLTQQPQYKTYSLHNFKNIPQIQKLPEEVIEAIEVVAQVLPFKTNNYVVNELIDWDKAPDDPLFILNFPVREMLLPEHYKQVKEALDKGVDRATLREIVNKIRLQLNPHPAGQLQYNVPSIDGIKLRGVQHKYNETVLFFPSQGQTCHAYCSFCFRWPQFVGMDDLKFAMREVDLLIKYLQAHPEVTDLLFTGGDPMIMRTKVLKTYIEPILEANIEHLQTIRIGTKALAYWPYRFISDPDADDLLRLFERIVQSGKHLAIMAHFNHPRELEPEPVAEATRRILNTGAVIRTQSPVLNHINADSKLWETMWKKQVNMGMIPYYMFVARDTGAHHFFAVPLVKAWEIYRNAWKNVSGLGRTARGPSMSATPGKVEVLGPAQVNGKKVLVLRMIQGRNPDWVDKPFFAEYDEKATWLDELKPAFSDKFFFEDELEKYVRK